jgi:hypothetical protein
MTLWTCIQKILRFSDELPSSFRCAVSHCFQADSGITPVNKSIPFSSESLPLRHSKIFSHLIRRYVAYAIEMVSLNKEDSIMSTLVS